MRVCVCVCMEANAIESDIKTRMITTTRDVKADDVDDGNDDGGGG